MLEVHRRTSSSGLTTARSQAQSTRDGGQGTRGISRGGDRVLAGELETTDSDAAYSVVRVLPRKSELKRPALRTASTGNSFSPRTSTRW